MKKTIRHLSLFVAFVMLLGVLAGCGGKSAINVENLPVSGGESTTSPVADNSSIDGQNKDQKAVGQTDEKKDGQTDEKKDGQNGKQSDEQSGNNSSAAPATTVNFIEDTSNSRIVNNKITFKMFVPKSPIQPQWEKMVLFQELEKRTNIKVDFEEVLLSSYAEKRSLKWEDRRNPPDAFFLANNMDEIVLYASRGALTPLNDLIDKYAPNYKKWLAKYPQIKKITTLADGKMYSFASVNTQGGDFAKQYINMKWLNKLGLPVPKTIDEFYNVLKAFKEQNPNGKNGKDEIPFSYINADQSRNFVMSGFGFVGTGMELDSRTNKMTWVPATNNYREYLKFMNKLYSEGLLDPYVFTNQSADLVVKGKSNQLGCFSSAGAFLVVGKELDNGYTSFGPLTSNINNQKMWYQFGRQFDPSILIIPRSSKYAKEIVRWMDVFYDEKTEPLQSNGIEGIDWKWTDASKTLWKFNVPNGVEREQYRATLTYQAGLGGAVLSTGFNLKDSSPETLKINKEGSIYRSYLREPFPVLQYKNMEMRTIKDIEAQLNNYMTTAEANFIKGIKDPNNDNDWNDHINTLNKINYKKLVLTYQSAYDRYKRN